MAKKCYCCMSYLKHIHTQTKGKDNMSERKINSTKLTLIGLYCDSALRVVLFLWQTAHWDTCKSNVIFTCKSVKMIL